MDHPEKTAKILTVRVTETQEKNYRQASNGKFSRWAKEQLDKAVEMANIRIRRNCNTR